MKYLIPFDFSNASKNAVEHAIRLATRTGGNLFILHIVDEKEQLHQKENVLKSFVGNLKLENGLTASSHVVVGDFLNDIGKIAEYHGADFVVMGTHGVDAMQKIFGSHAVKIIRHSTVPFIVIQEECQLKQVKNIIMPFSIEKESMQVLHFASQISKIYDAELHLLGRRQSDEFLQRKENTNVIMAKRFLVENNIKHTIEIVDVTKNKFPDYLLKYAGEKQIDLIATTYYSDIILPMFEKFVQNLIVNEHHIPVLCVNAKSLSKSDSILSFMTS